MASLSLIDAIPNEKHQEILDQNKILVTKVSTLEHELEQLWEKSKSDDAKITGLKWDVEQLEKQNVELNQHSQK